MAENKSKFLYCVDVMELLQCKATKARTVIRTLTDAQRQRVIGFAACLRTVDAVAVPQMHVLRKSGAAAV